MKSSINSYRRDLPPHHLHVDHWHYDFSNPIHQATAIPVQRHRNFAPVSCSNDRCSPRRSLGPFLQRLALQSIYQEAQRRLQAREQIVRCLSSCCHFRLFLSLVWTDLTTLSFMGWHCCWLGNEHFCCACCHNRSLCLCSRLLPWARCLSFFLAQLLESSWYVFLKLMVERRY
jgi:hypothetical protein